MFFNCMLDGAFDIAYIPSSRTNIHRSSTSAIDKYTLCGWYIHICQIIGRIDLHDGKLNEFITTYWLTLKAEKTKVLQCNLLVYDSIVNFIEIRKDFVKVLSDDESHWYLGRLLITSASNRSKIELRNCVRAPSTSARP